MGRSIRIRRGLCPFFCDTVHSVRHDPYVSVFDRVATYDLAKKALLSVLNETNMTGSKQGEVSLVDEVTPEPILRLLIEQEVIQLKFGHRVTDCIADEMGRPAGHPGCFLIPAFPHRPRRHF